MKCDAFDDDKLNKAVSDCMLDILETVQDYELGTEAEIAIAVDCSKSKKIIGEEGAGVVIPLEFKEPYITIHNHPSGKTISDMDFRIFIGHGNEKGAFVIGNNGNIYGIMKTEQFDWIEFQKCMIDKTYNEFLNELIQKGESNGLRYYERTFG